MIGCKGSLLSMAEKIQHAKASIQSITVYLASIFKIPILVAKRIDKICRNFIWIRTKEKKRISLVAWEEVCRRKKEGGLGIK